VRGDPESSNVKKAKFGPGGTERSRAGECIVCEGGKGKRVIKDKVADKNQNKGRWWQKGPGILRGGLGGNVRNQTLGKKNRHQGAEKEEYMFLG